MKDSLVAINITNNNKLLNEKSQPILFYWNGETQLTKSIQESDLFKNYIKKNVLLKGQYQNAKASWFCFEDVNGEDTYTEYDMQIQDLYPLSAFADDDEITEFIASHYIYPIFDILYSGVYKEPYKFEDVSSAADNIIDIYNKIKEKHPNRVVKTTVINYIRSKQQDADILTSYNKDTVIAVAENILKDKV